MLILGWQLNEGWAGGKDTGEKGTNGRFIRGSLSSGIWGPHGAVAVGEGLLKGARRSESKTSSLHYFLLFYLWGLVKYFI